MPDEKAHWADPKGDVVLHLRRMVLNSDTILEFLFYGHIFLYDWGGTSLRNVNQGFWLSDRLFLSLHCWEGVV